MRCLGKRSQEYSQPCLDKQYGDGVMSQHEFTPEELDRYSRHIALPEVGLDGQRRLKEARVLIVGAGGLGSPVGLYLAAAGVGTIGVVDTDTVSVSNLQRQILYRSSDIGKEKAVAAREQLLAINPTVKVVSYAQHMDSTNALELIGAYDIVADCTDNFGARYLVNDACVLLKKIDVFGSVFRFEGQVTVIDPTRGPCYRCLHPTPPPPELVQDCAEGGVLGVLPGIVGALQANEIMKLIIGKGRALVGTVLLVDALSADTVRIAIAKDPGCPVCGEHPTLRSLIDYDEFCSGSFASRSDQKNASEISVHELNRRLKGGEPLQLLDVREPHEHGMCNLGGRLIPLRELDARKSELDVDRETIVYCHHGIRSHAALVLLQRAGFRDVKNLVGGIDAWASQVDKSMPRY